MNPKKAAPEVRRWTAAELRKLPQAQRDAILEAAAALAEEDYRNDSQLTAFEAFGKDDLHGDSSNTETSYNRCRC
jgi:acyl-CoA reductase-like NAD-dependent aldehyde dehydrogenase